MIYIKEDNKIKDIRNIDDFKRNAPLYSKWCRAENPQLYYNLFGRELKIIFLDCYFMEIYENDIKVAKLNDGDFEAYKDRDIISSVYKIENAINIALMGE